MIKLALKICQYDISRHSSWSCQSVWNCAHLVWKMRSSLFYSSSVFLLICFRSSVFFFSTICAHLFFQMPICETFPLPFFFIRMMFLESFWKITQMIKKVLQRANGWFKATFGATISFTTKLLRRVIVLTKTSRNKIRWKSGKHENIMILQSLHGKKLEF